MNPPAGVMRWLSDRSEEDRLAAGTPPTPGVMRWLDWLDFCAGMAVASTGRAQTGSEQVRVPEAPRPQAGSEQVRVPEAPRPQAGSEQVRVPEAPLQQAGSEQVRVPEAPLPQAGSERMRAPEAPRMNSGSQQVREPEETPPKAKAQVKAKAEAKSGEEAPLPKAKAKAEAEVKTQERKEGQRGSGHASSSTSQSTQHAASTGSSQAKAGTPTQSTPVNYASLNTGGVATPPVVQLSFTGLGQRYHHRNDCYGLRNSRRVIRTDLCPICVPQVATWSPQGQNMFGAGLYGPRHADVNHCVSRNMDIHCHINHVSGARDSPEKRPKQG